MLPVFSQDQYGALYLRPIVQLIFESLFDFGASRPGTRLEENVFLLRSKDGKEKLEVLKSSKIVVHPATYDSGGMAAALVPAGIGRRFRSVEGHCKTPTAGVCCSNS
jgi:hypothetical protein